MKRRANEPRRSPSRRRRAAALALLAAIAPTGCGREFFREWANQDVSEAVFEKSRDPRWRVDVFSVDPPWMSRFADPYDQDFPPAPPDDYATQALSPVPQWSYNRLIVPVEGTGYLAMLGQFQSEHTDAPTGTGLNRGGSAPYGGVPTPGPYSDLPAPPATPGSFAPPTGPRNVDPLGTPPVPGDPAPGEMQNLGTPVDPRPDLRRTPPRGTTPPVPTTPGSATPGANPATAPRTTSPPTAPARPATPPASTPVPVSPNPGTNQARAGSKPGQDQSVRRTAAQAPATTPAPRQAPATAPAPRQAPSRNPLPIIEPPASDDPRTDPLGTPPIAGDTGPREMQNLGAPINPRPDLTDAGNAAIEAKGAELEGLLGTAAIDFIESEAIGLPRDARPYKINMAQALTLAFINARIYQFQLEQLYLAALPVTLQRFSFTPQFIAGLSPITPTTGPSSLAATAGTGLSPAINPSNAFDYRTRATGLGQQSLLNVGTVAAVGKSFDMGAKVLAGFASQLVFNFTGVNPRQPTVQSFIPIQAFVPFLRGGGRAVTLEGLTLAERQLLYQIRTFARFRQEFLITTLLGGSFLTFGTSATVQGYSSDVAGNLDPTIGYINVVEDIAIVENNSRNVKTYEQFYKVYTELIKGESSGLTQLQLDQLDSNLQNARTTLLTTRNTFRNDLDSFKLQIGLPPDVPLMVDRNLTQSFKNVYNEIEIWARKPGRQLSELATIAAKLPRLEDVHIDGRSCLETFTSGTDDNLEDLLLAAERVSLENRLDLMNYRAQLYDAWRQIRVTANALKGVFNVTITNQNLTPVGTTNPFAFLDQAKQFSLVLNAELPLVRMVERNNFRTALINYQRQRRQLMFFEDYQKLQLRSDIRGLQVAYLQYEISKRNFVLNARLKDQAFENIVAPPMSGGGATTGTNTGTSASAATQTNNLIQAQNALIGLENSLVTQWYGYQGARLTVYRDLGTLPYDEWEAFYEIFPSEYRGLGAGGRQYASPINASTPSQPFAGGLAPGSPYGPQVTTPP